MSRRRYLGCLAFSLLLASTAVHAAWERTGQTPSGAVYRMAVPEGWRAGDGVVVYQHDLSFEADLDPDLGPLRETQLQQGYAVIASGYSQAGWAAFASGQDNSELLERFRADVGEPGEILSYGTAMGGYIALQMADDRRLQVDGVLALCPVTAGHRRWDAALDLRLLYDAVCAEVPGGRLPAAADRPWLLDSSQISAGGLADIVARAGTCLGLDQPAGQRDADQQSRLDVLKAQSGLLDDAAVLPQLAYATVGLSDLVRDSHKLAGGAALGNVGVDYGDAGLNAAVRRIDVDAFAALDFRLRSGLRGNTDARVISLHGSADEVASSAHQAWLRAHWPASQLASVMVASDEPVRCGVEPAEMLAGWEALRAWTADAGAGAPDAVEVQARCLELVDGGDADGACRIDPEAVPLSLDQVARTRGAAVTQLDGRFSGDWHDPARPDEVWSLELLDGGAALLYGLTWPTTGGTDQPAWLIGTGQVSGEGIAFDQVYSLDGGDFGAAFAPDQARFQPWGSVRMVFDACGSARLRYRAVAPHGSGERVLAQHDGLGSLDCTADEDAAQVAGVAALSGSWYDPARPGQGLVLNVGAGGEAEITLLSYLPGQGTPMWLRGLGRVDGFGRGRFESVRQPQAASDAAEDALASRHWGRVEIDFTGCDAAVLRYRGQDASYGSGRLELSRLTRPLGLGGCGLER